MASCKSCSREITWAKTATGGSIPLTRVAHVYAISGDGVVEDLVPLHDKYISHFIDCPDAKTWSKGGAKPQQKELPDGSSEGT